MNFQSTMEKSRVESEEFDSENEKKRMDLLLELEADARKFYHDRMGRYFTNNVFMQQKELEEFHQLLVKLAINTCETTLEQAYEQYKETNYMNVPVMEVYYKRDWKPYSS
jgi:hypothetical protein